MSWIEVQPTLLLERILSIEIVRVTERAAVCAARMRGRGDELGADKSGCRCYAAGAQQAAD